MIDQLLQQLPTLVTGVVLVTSVFVTSLWLGMIVWTFRDIRARTRDVLVQLFMPLMVTVLNLPGFLLYLLIRPRETLHEAYEHALEQEALLQAIEEPLTCSACGEKIAEDFLFCPYCHKQLKMVCAACGRVLQLDWTLCPYCGTPVSADPVEAEGASVSVNAALEDEEEAR